jgi:hypothetical protein
MYQCLVANVADAVGRLAVTKHAEGHDLALYTTPNISV